jgi:hypothetical protein
MSRVVLHFFLNFLLTFFKQNVIYATINRRVIRDIASEGVGVGQWPRINS